MTIDERAENILLKGERGETTWSEEYREELKQFIAAELREAVEEDRDNPMLDRLADSVRYKARVQAEAYEEAAKVLETMAVRIARMRSSPSRTSPHE